MKNLISTMRNKQKGFTLIEIMIALVIMSIVLGAIYELYIHQYKTWVAQDLLSEMQQNARVAIDTMSRELIMAGYEAGGIDAAASTSIAFQEYIETATKVQQITFTRDTAKNKLTRGIKDRLTTGPDTFSAGETQDLAENITSLSFNYYDSNNNDLGAAPTLGDIRRVQISVTAQTARALPTTGNFKTQELRIDIYPRNLGIDTGFVDVSPPSAPTTFVVTDPYICGELNLTWDANTESDLAGYVIYYGQLTGEYDTKIKVEDSAAISYTLTGLSNADSDVPDDPQYFVVISAYDRAGNISAYSTEASGDGTGTHDTIPNADNPALLTNFEAADGANDEEIDLTWTASVDTDVVGYRLFRDTFAGFSPSGETTGAGNCIADESSLTGTTYTDTGLIGCRTYYYKICAINCDNTLVGSYVVADYPYAYGDGGGTDIVPDVPTDGVTDSTPTDADAVTDPKLASHAGYMRIFVTLTNPNLTSDPDYVNTEIHYSTTGPATLSSPLVENDASDVSSGMFTSRGVTSVTTTATFTHSGEATGSTPSLNPNLTYYYTAFAYDLCENVTSASAESTTLAVLCDDEPIDVPPVTTDLSASGCVHPVDLTWSWPAAGVGFPGGVYDLAGYYVYRSTDGGATYTKMNAFPAWVNEFTDAGVVEGVEYKYYVTSSDCVAENNPAAQSIIDRGGKLESDPSNIITVTPGSITDDDVKDEVLTGDISVVDAIATPPLPTYYHNTVKVYIKNTGAGTMTITDLYLTWDNSTAYLKSVTMGGETSATLEEVVWEDTVPPLTKGYSGASISISKQIAALDTGVPFIFEFAYSDGTMDERANMREDDISIDITYTNDSTGTTTCTSTGTLAVPLGPTIVGTAQDQPAVATLAWSVPGVSGTSVAGEHVIDPNVGVNVSAYIYDNSNVGFNSVTLYYITTDKATASAPLYDGANYTSLTMYKISGNLYRIYVDIVTGQKIPMQNDLRVWYFIVAEDCDGNFDRDPEIGSGAYTYDQQADDPCFDTPDAPTVLSGTTTVVAPGTDSVDLTWTAPATNTSGSLLTDLDGYNIYRRDSFSGVFSKINAAVVGVTTYTDSSLDLNANDYGYYVMAVDTCATPNESAASNIWIECVGSAGCDINANPTSINGGDGYTVTVVICNKAADAIPGDVITVFSTSSLDADSFTITEDGDTGIFVISLTTTATMPGTDIDTEIYVAASDTITIGYPDAIGSSCSATISVGTDPCGNTPSAPSGLSGTTLGQETVNLSWTAPTTNTDASALSDLGGYRIYESVDGGAYINVASVDASTTAYSRTVQSGKLKDHDYRYYVTAIDSCATPNESAASNIAGAF